jgi:hypothetical protein
MSLREWIVRLSAAMWPSRNDADLEAETAIARGRYSGVRSPPFGQGAVTSVLVIAIATIVTRRRATLADALTQPWGLRPDS